MTSYSSKGVAGRRPHDADFEKWSGRCLRRIAVCIRIGLSAHRRAARHTCVDTRPACVAAPCYDAIISEAEIAVASWRKRLWWTRCDGQQRQPWARATRPTASSGGVELYLTRGRLASFMAQPGIEGRRR
jgi:hypothetical protein